ncbi:MAG: carboxypeptidase regulatory-like domain-containing protein [Bacteroidetes bacterium]|nr:carboxypeptidase regulatory-like domain-containing protein [Bacteroidota bacterium]MBU2586213.1 carboxypeptidase regulatory-like domain-containing protein [Bacteroidota bacterium]
MHKLTKFFSRDNFQKSNFNQFSLLFVIIFSLVTCTNLFGQGITTAAIYGTVADPNGNPLVGANVVALHVPTGTIYGTTTRANGDYNLPNLRVGGPYTLTFSFIGYLKQEQVGLNLQLSQSLRQDFVASEEVFEAGEVVVTAERNPILNASRIGSASNVLREQIDRLPTITRNFADYYKLSPYFNGVNSSAAGRNNRYNNIQIDGVNFNDLFGLGGTGTPGGQSSVTPITLDAIEEFQIVVSPFDVRQAGFTGAGINAITRSGTNNFKGSAYYYGRNESLIGYSPDALAARVPGFTEYSTGFRLGGPIIENKLFFFIAGELLRKTSPFDRTFNADKVGTNAYTVSADSLKMISDYVKSKYGYETGSWSSIPWLDDSDKLFVRLDYNLSQDHKLTARWNYLNSLNDNSPSRFRGTNDVFSENARYKLVNQTHTFALQLTSLLGNFASNEFTLGYINQFDNPIYYGQQFPTVEISTSNPVAADKSTQRLAIGSEQYRHRNELGQQVFEITNNFSLYLPNHTVTIGVKVDLIQFRNLFIYSNFGLYRYNSIADFLLDKKAASYEYRYSADPNDPLKEANWGFQQYGFYIQDEWTVSPTFKVTGGIRFDLPVYTDKPVYNKAFDSTFSALGYDLGTNILPYTTPAISPRIGFNWAVDEERNTQLRGGVGLFSGRFPAVWVSNQYSNTGLDYYNVTTVPANFIGDPNAQPQTATKLPSAEVNVTDRNFKAPSIIRFNFAVDQRLPYNLIASVEGIYSISQNEVYYQNINLKGQQANGGITAGGKIVGEDRDVWGTLNATTGAYSARGVKVNNNFTAVYLVKNTDQGSNANLIFQLQRLSTFDGLYANLAYTWGLAKDIGGINSTTASSGWRYNPSTGNPNNPVLAYADNDRTHRFYGTVSYRHDWGWKGLATTLGLFYNGLSGRPFSYIVDGDVNGDGLTDNDLAYVPKDANDIILVDSKGVVLPKTDGAYAELMAYIDNDAYLKDHKGEMAERNGARSPWTHQIDLRITQEIPSLFGHKFEITFDILNVMNLIDKESGWVKLARETKMVKFHSIAPTGADAGKARYQWLPFSDPAIPDNLLSRWQAQLGIRYTF